MPREKFEHELQRLKDEILALRAMAESVRALKERDTAKAHSLIVDDRLINEKRYAIEDDTLTLIATQQPMAGDLRTLAAIFEIATELERIADYAKGIANVTLALGEKPLIKPLEAIPRMADKAMRHAAPSVGLLHAPGCRGGARHPAGRYGGRLAVRADLPRAHHNHDQRPTDH